MDTQWLDSTSDKLEEAWTVAAGQLQRLSDPARLRRIRQGLYVLAAIWLVLGAASLVWSLVPQADAPAAPERIINPLLEPAEQSSQASVNIEELAGWNLFGTAASKPVAAAVPEPVASTGSLDGIENSAKETKLSLRLQGILASSDQNQARAIIESKKKQDQYGIGDELPVSGKVTVAKILSDRVVLDNKGRYELLMLFDDKGLAASKPASAPARQPKVASGGMSRMDQRGNRNVTQMAESYRRRLYSNPQSLSQVVKIAAVRDGGSLQGYRVSAGKDRDQFKALGFEPNDIVTGVNGIELTDPGKAMELYRVMRSANEASFSVLRGGEEVTLVVGLEDAGGASSDSNSGDTR